MELRTFLKVVELCKCLDNILLNLLKCILYIMSDFHLD